MSTINVTNLIFELQKKIDDSINEQDILYYTKAIDQLKSNKVYVVDYTSRLPTITNDIVGTLYYVKEALTLYYADVFGWTRLDASNQTLLFGWGQNTCGKTLGTPYISSVAIPRREASSATDWCYAQAAARHSVFINTSGELWSAGLNCGASFGDGTTTTPCTFSREFCSSTDWCTATAGECQISLAIKTSGELWGWGGNASSMIGDGTTTNTCSPVREFCSATDWCQASTGSYASLAIKTDGSLWGWGTNAISYSIGDGTATNRCSPVREFCSATDWCQVSTYSTHSAAVKTTGEIWSWGANTYGQLGDGTVAARCSPVREICSATDWCQVRAGGASHAVGLKTNGTLWGWGLNGCGQLALGSIFNSTSPLQEFCSATNWCSISTAYVHTSALKTDNTLWSWGSNNAYRLGVSTSISVSTSPVQEYCSITYWCFVTAGCENSIAIASKTY